MGGKASAPVKAEEVQQIVEESSGTHFFELHLPSIGFSGAILCGFVLLLCALGALIRLCKKQRPAPPLQPMWAAPAFQPPVWQAPPPAQFPPLPPLPFGSATGPREFVELMERGAAASWHRGLPSPEPAVSRATAVTTNERFTELRAKRERPIRRPGQGAATRPRPNIHRALGQFSDAEPEEETKEPTTS